MDTTPAILLRRTKLTDSSYIVTWLTAQHGRLKTAARGARQAKSAFAGVLDLFHLCEIAFVRSRKSDLHALREARLVEPHAPLRTDYPRLALASYFAELLEVVTEPEHPVPELYDLLRRALAHLNESPATERALLHFEKELTRALGIAQGGVIPLKSLADVFHRVPSSRKALTGLPAR